MHFILFDPVAFMTCVSKYIDNTILIANSHMPYPNIQTYTTRFHPRATRCIRSISMLVFIHAIISACHATCVYQSTFSNPASRVRDYNYFVSFKGLVLWSWLISLRVPNERLSRNIILMCFDRIDDAGLCC